MWMAFRFIVELGDLGFSQIRKNIGAQYGIMYITVTTSIIWFLLVPLYRDKTGVVQQLISVLFTNEYISNLGICKKKTCFSPFLSKKIPKRLDHASMATQTKIPSYFKMLGTKEGNSVPRLERHIMQVWLRDERDWFGGVWDFRVGDSC